MSAKRQRVFGATRVIILESLLSKDALSARCAILREPQTICVDAAHARAREVRAMPDVIAARR